MQDCDLAAVEKEFARIAADPFHDAFLGLHNGTPAFLMERYDPAHRELVGIHAAEPGDVGMHFLSAPTDTPVHGFTRAVITTVMEMLFADPDTRRVVVEPDAAQHRRPRPQQGRRLRGPAHRLAPLQRRLPQHLHPRPVPGHPRRPPMTAAATAPPPRTPSPTSPPRCGPAPTAC